MIRNFDEMMDRIRSSGVKAKVALAAAHDLDALQSASSARKLGLADFVLIGDTGEIKRILADLGEREDDYQFVETGSDAESAATAARMCAEGTADLPMKGILHTSVFLKAILNKELGLVEKNMLLSEATVVSYEQENRIMLITDCAINVAPAYEEKLIILQNAVNYCHKLQIEHPRVAVIAPVEEVKTSMQSTVDAAMLSKACDRKQLKGCTVDGPLALDNALSLEAAKHKKIQSPVAGQADVLLMPDLAAGNILDKALRYFADYKTAGCVLGAKKPLIMTSRTDSAQNKLYAIACALLQVI